MIGQFNIYIYMLIPVLLPYFKKIRVNLRGFANLGEENKITKFRAVWEFLAASDRDRYELLCTIIKYYEFM